MTALQLAKPSTGLTSALGAMGRKPAAANRVLDTLIVGGFRLGDTQSSPYGITAYNWGTTTGSSVRIETPRRETAAASITETTAAAIMEIRRRSGLTWEELGDFFGVTRRSIHHWASGKPVSAAHDRAIRRLLAGLRRVDRGEAAATRALLLSRTENGAATLDLLKDGLIDEAAARAIGGPRPAVSRRPLSEEAAASRRPPPPWVLIDAIQDRPEIPSKARIGRAVRAPRDKG